ncbi:MAG: amidohydrolase/deacetylase family metallohydrolase [Dehalococcoidia bacterium]|nr:amidohydrolase/deacetylase family metallohydrolase [Dehalococcoidia bacterium]MSQ34297.1 amidohydrolase/deacetylase family metallohydrolase [Dehalococcoidia bacterium]
MAGGGQCEGKSVTYDIVIKNGTVIDPSQGLHAKRDVAIAGGRIAAVAEHIPDKDAHDVIEAHGLLVTPGLVDLHVHVWWGVAHLAVEADPSCLARGATTVVDAGSSGSNTIAGFHRYVMDQVDTRVLAFLNISGMGQLDRDIGELQDFRWARVGNAVEAARLHADRIVGIKVRLTDVIAGENDVSALERSIDAAAQISKPVMIHIGKSVHPLEKLLPLLRPRDIVTHSFTGLPHGILDNTGKVIDVARDARSRGVIFDVGHGAGSFAFETAEKAMADGFLPGTVSSDVHRYNIRGPVYDLLTTLSKYLHMGLALDEVIALGTTKPAAALGRSSGSGKPWSEVTGTLKVGAEADVAVIELREGPVTFTDSLGKTRQGSKHMLPVVTLKGGRRASPLHSAHPHLHGHGH